MKYKTSKFYDPAYHRKMLLESLNIPLTFVLSSHCMQWQLDFWTTDFSYFKNVSKFIVLIRLWEDSNPGPVIICQATKPLYTNEGWAGRILLLIQDNLYGINL